MLGGDGDDLRRAEIFRAEDGAAQCGGIVEADVLGANAERQLRLRQVLMHLRHVDRGAVDAQAPRSTLEARMNGEEVHWRRADEVGDEHRGRPVVDILRRSELLHDAAIHHRDLVGHRHSLELVVRDVDGGGADAVVELAQLVNHQVAKLRVERAERLIHQEDLRPPHDGAAQRDALAVAAGKPGDRAVEDVVDPEEPRRLLHPRLDVGARHSLADEREGDVLPDVHVGVEREELEHEGDVALRRALEGDVLPVEQDAPGGRQLQPRNHPKRRRLAAARRAEHDKELAIRDRQVGILDGDEIAELLAEVLDADLGHRASPGNG